MRKLRFREVPHWPQMTQYTGHVKTEYSKPQVPLCFELPQEERVALPQSRPKKSLEDTGAKQSAAREAPSWGLKEVAGAGCTVELQFLGMSKFPGP